ncbi:MAG: UDP-glucose 4-epimerase GalE [Halothiobacillus sp. 14-56-357]|jgi:UDP-glucose 4-epimerase|uniref:UDP-glucose 4-epimerase GalE n=1 Tax=Halothiobacillus sp. 15-55-196 TaxID=1970382 RepID=UPI000BC79037|nr:UDP-glucose 4-epimerase GalE [Halothiobacillus sp. 15-55-196]OZB35678.1 MAG: UDP-glucose 4-epimerase GalE [Halothiobacillus sp. 15-55-196]OZB57463.1 MAG: UDP-glucose 4-epimerase GalE [Halothiobacillus sp. 14-56-357]OZB79398.1 MAG: UDP-glucose 4-epimerase GalE [Halothiobacillus sp. 13-55-115]
MQSILVVGGAGYIGSHMVKYLARAGHRVVVLDNLSTGHADAVRYGELNVGDMADTALLDRLFHSHRFDAVMHFAAFSLVGESVDDPGKYYRNNVGNTLNLLDAMVRHQVRHFIFSSTAATFGEPRSDRIDESHPQNPINPYGRSKLMVEQLLADYDAAYGLKSVCLRYFNAAGADPEGELGERHNPETHLIPLVLQAASGRRPHIHVFGTDYDTPDGSCLRDYIHVQDLCSAHHLALQWLQEHQQSQQFNLGNGDGYSVLEVIAAAREVTGKEIPVIISDRRPGDPARLIADATLAHQQLDWKPEYPALEDMITHAWHWEQSH